MTAQWLPRRPSPTFANIGKPLGETISAPTREAAERIAIARHGSPVIVERIVRRKTFADHSDKKRNGEGRR